MTTETYRLIVCKPGKVVRLDGEFVTIGKGEHIAGEGKGLAEATRWMRRSRFRRLEREDR